MSRFNGYIVASVFWGLNIPMTHLLLRSFDPFWLSPVRHLLASLILGALVWATLNRGQLRSPIPLWRLLVMGCGVAGFLVLFNVALTLGDPIRAAAVIAGSPVYVAVVSRWMTGARLEPGFWGATLLTLVGSGIALTSRASSTTAAAWPGSELLIVLAVASWTVYSILAQRWFAPEVAQLRRTWLTALAAVPVLLACWALARAVGLAGPPNLHPDADDLANLLIAATLCTALATVAWNHGVSRLGIQAGAVWQNMVPVFAVLFAWGMFGVAPSLPQVLGGAVVMGGVGWLQWHRRRRIPA